MLLWQQALKNYIKPSFLFVLMNTAKQVKLDSNTQLTWVSSVIEPSEPIAFGFVAFWQ